MRELILWGVTALAAVAFVALALHLWRRLRVNQYRWGIGETFAALGLVVTVLVAVLPQLLATDDDSIDPAVVAYREQVRRTCRALVPTTNPLLEAMGDGLQLDRTRLEQGLRNQLAGSYGVLQNFWNAAVRPESLADQADGHRRTATPTRGYLRRTKRSCERAARIDSDDAGDRMAGRDGYAVAAAGQRLGGIDVRACGAAMPRTFSSGRACELTDNCRSGRCPSTREGVHENDVRYPHLRRPLRGSRRPGTAAHRSTRPQPADRSVRDRRNTRWLPALERRPNEGSGASRPRASRRA